MSVHADLSKTWVGVAQYASPKGAAGLPTGVEDREDYLTLVSAQSLMAMTKAARDRHIAWLKERYGEEAAESWLEKLRERLRRHRAERGESDG